MSISIRAALAAVVLLTFSAVSRADVRSDIMNSGRSFAKALMDGDVATAKKYAITNDQSDRMLDALAKFMHANQKLEDAAVAKFGDAGKQIMPGGRIGPAQYAKMEEKMKDAKVDVSGNTAVVTPKDSQKPTIFKKEGGTWKIDLTDRTANMPNERNLAQFDAMIGAMDKTTGEIKDGKYKTADEARQGLYANLGAAMGGGNRRGRTGG